MQGASALGAGERSPGDRSWGPQADGLGAGQGQCGKHQADGLGEGPTAGAGLEGELYAGDVGRVAQEGDQQAGPMGRTRLEGDLDSGNVD